MRLNNCPCSDKEAPMEQKTETFTAPTIEAAIRAAQQFVAANHSLGYRLARDPVAIEDDAMASVTVTIGPPADAERDITDCAGYRSLLAAVERDYEKDRRYQEGKPPFHEYRAKMDWAIERARHYGAALGMDPCDILNAWEDQRDYWYMNYYQDVNQPRINTPSARVFETLEDLKSALGDQGYRCPACGGVSSNPNVCDTGINVGGEPCDWKAFGLFGALSRGVFVFVKERMTGHTIFMPVAWEDPSSAGDADEE